MPKVLLGRKPPDILKGIIRDAMDVQGLNIKDLAEIVRKSDDAMYKWMRKPTTEWKLSDLLLVCKKLDIPINDLRDSIRYT